MKMKMLLVIANSDKKIEQIVNKFKLPFNVMMKAYGTASESLLNFFGLMESEKYIGISLINEELEKDILLKITDLLKIKNVGAGIALTISLTSSSKYVMEAFKEKVGDGLMEKSNKKYHLLVTIVNHGCAEQVMNAAKRQGASGGTIISGREIGGKNSFKFFNITMEAEKDIVLIVCEDKDKNTIMEEIINKTGLKKEGQGLTFSLPIDNVIGLIEH